MFLRRIFQSSRVARVPVSSPSIHPIPRYPFRSLLYSATLYPGRCSVSHDTSSSSNPTFAASERNSAVLKTDQVVSDSEEEPAPTLKTIEDFEAALDHAFSQKNYPAVEAVVSKLVDLYRSESALSFSIFHSLLQREDESLLSDSIIRDILRLIRSSPYEARDLPPQILQHIFRQRAHDKTIQTAILDILQLQIQAFKVPDGPGYVLYEPPATIQQAFMILPSIIVKQSQVALDIFNTLLERGFIPPESVQDPDLLKTDDITLIMFIGLARASIHWDLPGALPEIIKRLMQTKSAHHPIVRNSLLAFTNTLLDNQAVTNSPATLKACLAIIRVHRVADNVVRRFYSNARQYDCGSEARDLYAFTRGVLGETHRPYPAPRMMELGWLMEYLYDSGEYDLCQALAREVLDDRLPIPTRYCLSFLRSAILTSSTDDVEIAEGLWKRYVCLPEEDARRADHERNHPAPATPYVVDDAVWVKKTIQSDGAISLAMVRLLRDAIRAKATLVEKGSDLEVWRLNRDIRRINVLMHRIASDFECSHDHFHGALHLSYRVRILLTVGRYKDAVTHLRALIQLPEDKVMVNDIRSCWEVMLAQDAGFTATLIEELEGLGVAVDTKICLDLLACAATQKNEQVEKYARGLLSRRGVEVGTYALETLAIR